MNDVILIPNAPILIESTRAIGYSFETALADIIDNSLAKRAKKINVWFDSEASPYIAVVDDGAGMTEEELKNAMRYGSQSSLEERCKDDLGRFGLGMKTASLSQCRKLSVLTKKNGNITGAIWDLDYVIKKNEWILKMYDTSECEEIEYIHYLDDVKSGTVVVWENFDRIENTTSHFKKSFDQKIEDARSHLALVFHRFLNDENPANRVSIYFNNNKLKPVDPFLTNNPATQPLSEQTIIINSEPIRVKPFVLPYMSKLTSEDKKMLGDISDLRKTQGFYVYRNKRLIIWGTWFKLVRSEELNKLARVRVDIPNSLDSVWDIDIKKSSASLPDSIKLNLKNIVKSAIGTSERVYKYRGRKSTSDELIHMWNVIDNRGKYSYQVNRELPLYKELLNKLDDEGEHYLNTFIEMLENTFPFEDIYYRMGKNEIQVSNNKLEFEDVYIKGKDVVDSALKQKLDVKSIINSLKSIDFFAKYPEVIDKLLEEYSDEQ